MQIIYRMAIELTRRSALAPLDAVQGDGSTRAVKLSLLENGKPWEVPEGVTAAVAFRKADGHKGLYDTLPDGSKAVTVDGSAVTAVLAPQVLSCPGEVRAAVVFYNGDLQQLATFPFPIRVERNPAAGQALSNDYYRYSTMEDVSQAVEEALQAVEAVIAGAAPAIVCEAMGGSISVTDAANRPLQGLTLYGKTLQNGTPTPESPVPLESVGSDGSIAVAVCGKNLVSSDVITLKGRSNIYVFREKPILLPKGTYTISLPEAALGGYLYEHGNPAALLTAWGKTSLTFTLEAPTTVWFDFFKSEGFAEGTEHKVQLEMGSAPTEYEPYKDGGSLTVSTPNGLPGIPVESGGNYTDENGQAWVCDEIDFARGVYVRKVGKTVFDGSSDETWLEATTASGLKRFIIGVPTVKSGDANTVEHLLTNQLPATAANTIYSYDSEGCAINNTNLIAHFLQIQTLEELREHLVSKPLTVLFELAVPIETDLSAEELAVYAALHSCKPTTTVYNDAGAGQAVEYVADTKTYIDQKLAAISAAMLNA